MNEITPIGHNNPPAYDKEAAEALEAQAREVADEAASFKEAGAITTEVQAETANDFIAKARALFKKVEDQRKADKEPHLSAGRAVDDAYKTIGAIITKAAEMVKPMQEAYLRAKQEEERKRREEEQRKAREAAEKAEEERLAAEARNDVAGQVEADEAAEAALKAAAEAEKETKARVGSASGGAKTQSLRTVYTAEISSINQALLHYRENDKLRALLVQLANADLRAAKDKEAFNLPGFEIKKEQKL